MAMSESGGPGMTRDSILGILRPEWVRVDGQRLRRLRVMKAWTQEALAGKAGVSTATVVRLERNRNVRCRCGTATRLAKTLGEEFTALILRSGDTAGYVAFWSRCQRQMILVADHAGHIVDLLPIPLAADCTGIGIDLPGTGMLRQTAWSACPGAEWQEARPGQWSVPVISRDRSRGGDRDELRSGCR
jgi:DNA-binding XRE family transcriptional regulator